MQYIGDYVKVCLWKDNQFHSFVGFILSVTHVIYNADKSLGDHRILPLLSQLWTLKNTTQIKVTIYCIFE